MWYGKKAKSTLKSKARLMAEKINKNERKNKAEILTDVMGVESEEFLLHLGVEEYEQQNLQIVVSFLSIIYIAIIKILYYLYISLKFYLIHLIFNIFNNYSFDRVYYPVNRFALLLQ